jgi:hypothetical protein
MIVKALGGTGLPLGFLHRYHGADISRNGTNIDGMRETLVGFDLDEGR